MHVYLIHFHKPLLPTLSLSIEECIHFTGIRIRPRKRLLLARRQWLVHLHVLHFVIHHLNVLVVVHQSRIRGC